MSGSRSAFLRVTAALAVVFIFTGGVHQLRSGVNAAPDFPCSVDSAVDVSIEISKGATGSAIALQLYEAGVIESSPAFFRLAVADKRSTMIAPGAHILGKEICAADALDQLLDSKRIAGLINIIEGAWSSEIIKSMVAADFKETDIKSAISQIRLPTGLKVLEGLLFPAQYSFAKGTSAQDALQAMMDRAMTELSRVELPPVLGNTTHSSW